MWRLGWLIPLAVSSVLSGHGGPAQERQSPNVLLVTIDTLRADRIGAYGYKEARTPTLDALAAAGVRFEDATAHAPLTLPSHAAILTGRYPGVYGLRLNGMGALPDSAITIAERLKSRGYRTGAVVASVILDRTYGLAQGMDDYDDRIAMGTGGRVTLAELQRPADQVTAAAKAWIARQRAPWFLWVHYYDPHLPYEPPAQYAALAAKRPYDGEVAFVDAELGSLISSVDRTRTAIVVTSDHGEALGEHGEPDHGFFLYDVTLRVPLIIVAPGVVPRVVSEQVRGIDISPTIAALAGLGSEPEEPTRGESLVRVLEGGSRREVPLSLAESWYPRLHFGWSELRSARVGEWKYIAAPKPELYDLRVDSSESRNLAADRSQVAGRLAADLSRLTSRFGERGTSTAEPPDPATIERLQALGYLGAFSSTASTPSGDDPKDRAADYRQYRELFNRALTLLTAGKAGDAVTSLQKLVKMNVRAFEAHLYLGNAYAELGRGDAALGEYEVASQLNPELATPYFEAAKVLSDANDHEAAVARCLKGLERSPRSAFGHYTLGVIYRRAGRLGDARQTFMRAVELNPHDPRARANLASLAMRQGNLELARAQFQQMIALEFQVAPAHFNLGMIAMRRGDRAEAERHFRLALEADPTFKPARDALAKLR